MPYLFSYWAPIGEAADFARAMNGWLADAVRRFPGVYYGLGTVPLQDPEVACQMLSEVRAAGLQGIEIGTHVNGMSIAEARFRPLFVEAARLGLSVFLHAFEPPEQFGVAGAASNAVAFPLDIAHATTALIFSGTIEAASGLRLCVSHGGGGLALTLPRLTHTWRTSEKLRERLSVAPDEQARRLFYDSLLYDPAGLRYVIERMGGDRLVAGSDYPFTGFDHEWTLQGLDLSDEQSLQLRSTTPRRFLGLID
jgi:aminocarboxymuconate-semialdehyde decarboxylase